MGDERRWAVLLPAWEPYWGSWEPYWGSWDPEPMLPLQAAPVLELQHRLLGSCFLAVLRMEKELLAHRVCS